MVSRSASKKDRQQSTPPREGARREDSPPSEQAKTEEERMVREAYQELCRELNMDSATCEVAWKSYEAIRQNYTLEGDQLHWLACALFVACHNSAVPTVNKQGVVGGNGISLTRLLRSCKLSLIQFFNKAKKWADMSNMKSEFREKIKSLEDSFVVTIDLFKKYQEIFVYLFKDPSKDPPKVNRSRKQKKPPCTPGEVFDFCWGLFVYVKTEFPAAFSYEIVQSYYLMLSCMDYIYGNAVMSGRTDLLSDAFAESQGNADKSKEPPCILDSLCRVHGFHDSRSIAHVKSIRLYDWKPQIQELFDHEVLKGDRSTLTGILDPAYFEVNAKNVRKKYEEHMLNGGEYDERVFLGDDANEEIGTPSKLASAGAAVMAGEEAGEKIHHARRSLFNQFDGSSLIPTTPLSGKHYLKAKEQLKVTPISTATYLVSRLNSLLGKREAEPSKRLQELFATCDGGDPTDAITKRVKDMGDLFCSHYVAPSDKHPGSRDSFAQMRLKMGGVLYYKLLEAILFKEKDQNKPLGNLLSQDIFHRALFTCCLEIVIFSYNSQRVFPWILDVFKLEPIHFYKVIEVIIRTEDSLPRDVVKHLQRIEEQILESRAWVSSSPLWDAIARDPQGVPSCEEVSLPGQSVAAEPQQAEVALPGQSPVSHHKRPFAVVRSPMAGDRFKSPVVTAVARRQLAFNEANVAGPQITPTSPVKPSLQGSPQKALIQVQGQGVKAVGDGKIVLQQDEASSKSSNTPTHSRPKRTGSLALFFRKVYHVAHLRLDALCFSLQIADEETKRKIWTTFEYTLTNCTELMRDRHLDQLLMCSLYIVNKVIGLNKNFTDIMKEYRNQPQAASHVYRSVLLGAEAREDEAEEAALQKEEGAAKRKQHPPPTPTRLAATSTVHIDGEERGDLIKFYNMVFRKKLQEFVLKFSAKSSQQGRAPPLSPLPKLRSHPQSPRRKVSENHSVYIRPLKTSADEVVSYNPGSPHKPLQYSFSRSPAKNLDAINQLMRTEGERRSAISKRLLADDASENLAATAIEIPGETQMVIIQQEGSDEPPTKLQIIGQAAGKVNSRLGIVLGERSMADSS